MRWAGSMAAIVLGLFWLELLGAGDLAGPPLSLDGAASWLEQRDTDVVVFSLLRLGAMAVGWYLLLITAVGGAATVLRLRRIAAAMNRLTVPFARGILGGVTLLGVASAPPPVAPPTPDSMIELPPDTTAPRETATLRLLPDPAPPSPPPSEPTPPSAPDHARQDIDTPATTWVVQHGESFWSIASELLTDLHRRAVSEDEVAPYWRLLVELNRSRLVNPNDADLLYVGQEIELPALASG
jgi:hypothetical protein